MFTQLVTHVPRYLLIHVQLVISVSVVSSSLATWTELSKINWVTFSGSAMISFTQVSVFFVIKVSFSDCMNPCLILLSLLHSTRKWTGRLGISRTTLVPVTTVSWHIHQCAALFWISIFPYIQMFDPLCTDGGAYICTAAYCKMKTSFCCQEISLLIVSVLFDTQECLCYWEHFPIEWVSLGLVLVASVWYPEGHTPH